MEANLIKPVIILVETQLPENLGSVARTMGNFDLVDLRLVNPLINPLDPKALATAVKADFILNNATLYPTLQQAIFDLNFTFAATIKKRDLPKYTNTPKECINKIYNSHIKTGVIFGPERTGLNNFDVSICSEVLTIPVSQTLASLNLAQAVNIFCYEWFQYKSNPYNLKVVNNVVPASYQKLSDFLSFLESKLDDVNFWRVPHKKPKMLQNLTNFFSRSKATLQDLQTLYGVIDTLSRARKSTSSAVKD